MGVAPRIWGLLQMAGLTGTPKPLGGSAARTVSPFPAFRSPRVLSFLHLHRGLLLTFARNSRELEPACGGPRPPERPRQRLEATGGRLDAAVETALRLDAQILEDRNRHAEELAQARCRVGMGEARPQAVPPDPAEVVGTRASR